MDNTIVVDPSKTTLLVEFPSGTVKKVQLLRLLVQTQNAEFKASHDMFLPGIAKQHATLAALRDEYEIPAEVSRTWAETAPLLRRFYDTLREARING